MALARADQSAQRFYSLSAQIQRERKGYYDMLERTQKGTPDVTDWLEWFLNCSKHQLRTETLGLKLEKLLKGSFLPAADSRDCRRIAAIRVTSYQHIASNRLPYYNV